MAGNGWIGLLGDVLGTVLKSRGGASSTGGRRRARLKSGRGADPAPGASRDTDEPSPGRDGSDATRDLTTAEIRGLRLTYAPDLDGTPDPGEVVWTWVPFVEHDGRGKDRPVLVVARLDRTAVAVCYLSTKQHDGFISMGSGDWDSQGRESFLSTERVLRVTDGGMRREGTVMPESRFAIAAEAISRAYRLG